MKQEKQNTLTIVLFAVYMLLLIGIILFKLPFYSEKLSDGIRIINLIPFKGSFDENGLMIFREIIYNILLFIPFGIYICMLREKWTLIKKVITIVGLTVSFEIIQFIFAIGRTDITDIIDNMVGGIAGICMYALLFKAFKNRTVIIVNITALIVTICVSARFLYLFYLSHFVIKRLHF